MILEATRWMKKFLLLSCSLWKPHLSLASSPGPKPNLGRKEVTWCSKEVAWWRNKFPPVADIVDS
jgi:hypothetical protein